VCLNGVFTCNLQLQPISGPRLAAGTFLAAPLGFAPDAATAFAMPGSGSAPQHCYLHYVEQFIPPSNTQVRGTVPGSACTDTSLALTEDSYLHFFIFLRKCGTQLPKISHHNSKHEMFQYKSEADNKAPLTYFPLVRLLSCLAAEKKKAAARNKQRSLSFSFHPKPVH